MASALRFFFLLLGLFAAEVLAHITLLHLPYYWDEAGYYVPAAYDFFRTGTLIPFSTLTNAHPPGLSLYLAAAWKLFGFAPVTTRVSSGGGDCDDGGVPGVVCAEHAGTGGYAGCSVHAMGAVLRMVGARGQAHAVGCVCGLYRGGAD
jgi:hypothetical protein